MSERTYSDVEYLRKVYLDAELIDGIWYREESDGALLAFGNQERVIPKTLPALTRRHAPDCSGHAVPPEQYASVCQPSDYRLK